MRLLVTAGIAACALGVTACDKSSSSDPKTVTRGELNPPTGLVTVTHDKSIELRWKSANTEDEFQGYDVFMVEGKTVKELNTGTLKYPKNLTIDLATGAVPRCVDNSQFFVDNFQFPASTADCEGDAEDKTATGGSTGSAMMMVDDTTTDGAATEAADDEPAPTNIKLCDGTASGSKVSLVATGAQVGDHVCKITGLENGKSYTFFVASVKGEKFNSLSWTSNFVSDTPSTPLFDGDVTITTTQVVTFSSDNLKTMTAWTTAPASTKVCTDFPQGSGSAVCSINKHNDADVEGIYFGRLGGTTPGSYKQRTFLSVPADSNLKILLRGPQTMDPEHAAEISKSIPGDAAVGTDAAYDTAGTLFPLYGNEVFDIQYTNGANKYYGKVVIGELKLAGDEASALTIPVTIIMQPKAGSTDYFTGFGGSLN